MATNKINNFKGYKTVTQISKNTDISRTIVSQLFNTKNIPDKTRFDVLEKISHELNIPIEWLFSQDDSWNLLKMEKIDMFFLNNPEFDTYILTVSNTIFGKNKPLLLSVEFSKQYNTINMELLTSNDLNMLYEITGVFYNHLPFPILNLDIDFIYSINSSLTKKIAETVIHTQTFTDNLNSFIETNNQEASSKYRLNFNLRSVNKPILVLNNKCIIADDESSPINEFDNQNILKIYHLKKGFENNIIIK